MLSKVAYFFIDLLFPQPQFPQQKCRIFFWWICVYQVICYFQFFLGNILLEVCCHPSLCPRYSHPCMISLYCYSGNAFFPCFCVGSFISWIPYFPLYGFIVSFGGTHLPVISCKKGTIIKSWDFTSLNIFIVLSHWSVSLATCKVIGRKYR